MITFYSKFGFEELNIIQMNKIILSLILTLYLSYSVYTTQILMPEQVYL